MTLFLHPDFQLRISPVTDLKPDELDQYIAFAERSLLSATDGTRDGDLRRNGSEYGYT
jgi:hypothetical protein